MVLPVMRFLENIYDNHSQRILEILARPEHDGERLSMIEKHGLRHEENTWIPHVNASVLDLAVHLLGQIQAMGLTMSSYGASRTQVSLDHIATAKSEGYALTNHRLSNLRIRKNVDNFGHH